MKMNACKHMRWLVALAYLSMSVAGCSNKTTSDTSTTLQLIFDDARGLSRGAPVVARGIPVGQVAAQPVLSDDGKQVVVTITIDQLQTNLHSRLTTKTKASIKRDLLGIQGAFVELTLADDPGVKLDSGSILTNTLVFNLASWAKWPPDIEIPTDESLAQWILRGVLPGTAKEIGLAPYWVNLFATAMLGIVLVCLVLDGIIRLAQGSRRERPSWVIFQHVWAVFVVSLFAKIMTVALRITVAAEGGWLVRVEEWRISIWQKFVGIKGTGTTTSATEWIVPVTQWPEAIQPDFVYWIIVLVVIVIRFKFDLLVRRVRTCD